MFDITRKFIYTKNGETKEGSSNTYLNLTAATALVDQRQFAYQLAKNIQDHKYVEIYIFSNFRNMLYIFTQVSRMWLRTTLQMECLTTLPQPAQTQPGISPTLSWTDTDFLTLEQIYNNYMLQFIIALSFHLLSA